MKKIIEKSLITVCAMAAGFSTALIADDTEIYFNNDAAIQSAANVLLVLDYSGSMKLTPTGSTPAEGVDSRLDIMNRVVEKVVASAPASLALGVSNYGGHTEEAIANGIQYPVRLLTDEQREGMQGIVSGFKPDGYTPIVQSLYEASLYFRGDAADYGNNANDVLRAHPETIVDSSSAPETVEVTTTLSCKLGSDICNGKDFKEGDENCTTYDAQVAKFIDETKCVSEDEAGRCLKYESTGVQIEIPASLEHTECTYEGIEQDVVYNRTYQSPIANECQANYIILLSDGEADDGVAGVDPIIKNKLGKYSINCADAGDGTCGAELTHYLANNDISADYEESQTLKTYTIGFANSDAGNGYLSSLANLGEGNEETTAYFEADDEDRLLQVFNDIIDDIAGNVGLLTPPVFNADDASGFTTGTEAYLPLFRPSQLPEWSGNLKKYKRTNGSLVGSNEAAVFDEDGSFSDDVQSYWSEEVDGASVKKGGAASLLGATRNLLIDNASSLVPFSQDRFTEESLGLESDDGVTKEELYHYAKGLEGDSDLSRSSMGDLLHSRPVVVSYEGREDVIFAGSNDGFLYAIDSETGEELFAFMPSVLLPILKTLYINDAEEAHPYGVDGDITVFRSEDDTVYLYFGLRRGGRDYYALNITDPTKPSLAWHIAGGGKDSFEELGQSWSKPIATKLETGDGVIEAVLFAGGYDPSEDGSCSIEDTPLFKCPTDKLETEPPEANAMGSNIYAVNAHTGKLSWSMGTNNPTYEFDEMSNSIPSNLAVMDFDSNGIADRIYAVDIRGKVFRVDLPDTESTRFLDRDEVDKPTGRLLAELGGTGNQRFYHEPDIALQREGLRQYISVAVGSGYQAHPLVKDETDRLYLLKDYGVSGLISEEFTALNDSSLADASNSIVSAAPNGWYIDLDKAAGEKALARAVTLNGMVYFTTFSPATPADNVCTSPLHGGAFYRINISDASSSTRKIGEIDDSEPSIDGRKTAFSTADIPTEVFQTFSQDEKGRVVVDTFLGPNQGSLAVDQTFFEAVQKVYWEEVH